MAAKKNSLFYSITFRFSASVALLLISCAIGWLVLKENIRSQRNIGAVINISGRQRMLSQRIGLFALRLVNAEDEREKGKAQDELKAAVSLMRDSHADLMREALTLYLFKRDSRQLKTLGRRITNYLNQAESLYLSSVPAGFEVRPNLKYILRESDDRLLALLDGMVKSYQQAGKEKIRILEAVLGVVFSLNVLIIAGIGIFIFMPMARRIRSEMDKLNEQAVSLSLSNENLQTQIKKRSELEKKLIDSNEFNFKLLETIPFGIDIVDEEGVILYQNDKMRLIFGPEAIGKKCYSLYKDDKKQCGNCPLKKDIISGQTRGIEVQGVLNGKTFLITHTKMVYQGKDAILEVFEDISDYKRLQEKLESSHRLADTGRMSGAIAHEFRNQLGVIGNAAYFLKMKVKDKDEKVLRHLAIIEEQIAQTEIVIGNILNFAHAKQPRFEKTDLGGLLSECIEKLNMPKEINIIIRKDDMPPAEIDPVQIRGVFVNILLNAAEAMGDKGSLVINISRNENRAEINFKDSGPGLKEEDRLRLFEPFFTTKARGSGLGLATAKGIIEKHNGSISIESEYGNGVSVLISIPIKQEV